MNQSANEGPDGPVGGAGIGRPASGNAAAGKGKGILAVLGIGQIGGSIALGGRAAGLFQSVAGFGHRDESLRRARALGLCDVATTSAADAVANADTVVLATPLRAIPAVVAAMVPGLKAGALVIDVGSVKGTAARDIEARLPATVDFVACHPLAGTEHFGPEAARADLFRGRQCLICPTPRTSGPALDRARALWHALGADTVTIEAGLHDRVMAAVSHIPHVAAYALAGALMGLPPDDELAARSLPTTSLRDTTRVAASSPAMWRDIFLENQVALLPLIDKLASRLDEIKQAIIAGDDARVFALLEAGRASRARIFGE